MSEHWCELAWLGGERAEPGVLISVQGDRITSVERGVASAPAGAGRHNGLTIPGLSNAHSHAFQRALRGRTHAGRGDFWTWRDQMYAAASMLDPDNYLALARATFAEMALAGITTVGEFHYVHHGPAGVPYEDPNAMGEAVLEAATQAGVRITLLETCYLHGGIGAPPDEAQQRFSDGTAETWVERVSSLSSPANVNTSPNTGMPPAADPTAKFAAAAGPTAKVGAAIHSVRAVDPASAATVSAWAAEHGLPLHAHVSEQPAENAACLAEYGMTPSALLGQAGALGERFTAIHATHLTESDFGLLGGGSVCLCPTTERDLADGIGPVSRLAGAGAGLCLGTDSNALIDILEEARGVELDERLSTGIRGNSRPADLLRAATDGGCASLGWDDAGRIEAGALADLVTLGFDRVGLAGTTAGHAVESAVFAAGAADVRDVMVGGRVIVRDRVHLEIDVAAELSAAIGAVIR